MKHRKVIVAFVVILCISLVQFAATEGYSQSRQPDPAARFNVPTEISPVVDQAANQCPSGICDLGPLTRVEPLDLDDGDHEGCDPSYRPELAPPPKGAKLGVPTFAPPQPTPIHPVSSRFDAPVDQIEVVQVSVTMESAQ